MLVGSDLLEVLDQRTNQETIGTTRNSAAGCQSAFTNARMRPTRIRPTKPPKIKSVRNMTLLATASIIVTTLP